MSPWDNDGIALVESSVRSRHMTTDAYKSILIYEGIQCEERTAIRDILVILDAP